ncbi:DUF4097 family beta strand repeat-containing protein [Kribbella sp. NPDC056861]|uniref:DUF4097 family beta strand repeat-containing protein n=1 Tax=Kribbella sp. NPDC056861 TaxID=3154857 RepID=UPI003413BC50
MRRGYEAPVDGPIAIEVGVFAQAGSVKVQVREDCTRAVVGLSTTEEEGPSAAAVRDAAVESGPAGQLIATVHGTSTQNAAPVEVTVVAPPGSTLVARADSAHIGAAGLADAELTTGSGNVSVPEAGRVFVESGSGAVTIQKATDVNATSQSGAVSVGAGHRVTARTASGAIVLAATSGEVTVKSVSGGITVRDFQGGSIRADNTSGAITIHATASGDVRAGTISGAITVTAVPGANLNLRTSTTTGQVKAP